MVAETKTHDMVLTRVFDAPVEKVWRAWSESELVKGWWGPTQFTCPVARMDFRVGGASLVCMRSPDGHDMYNTWTYTEIVPLQRIEFIHHFSDKDGRPLDPAAHGLPPGVPREVRHVLTFRALDGNHTELSVTEFGYTSEQIVDMSRMGMEQCLDKMAAIFAAQGTTQA